jgi:hypothetical protein
LRHSGFLDRPPTFLFRPSPPTSPRTRARFDPIGYIEARLGRHLGQRERSDAMYLFDGNDHMMLDPYIQYLYDAPSDLTGRLYDYARNRIGRHLSRAEDDMIREWARVEAVPPNMEDLMGYYGLLDRPPSFVFRPDPDRHIRI